MIGSDSHGVAEALFIRSYTADVTYTQADLELTDIDHAQVFVICNKVDEWLTGNLLGPIVVNAQNRLAQQVVLTEQHFVENLERTRTALEERKVIESGRIESGVRRIGAELAALPAGWCVLASLDLQCLDHHDPDEDLAQLEPLRDVG